MTAHVDLDLVLSTEEQAAPAEVAEQLLPRLVFALPRIAPRVGEHGVQQGVAYVHMTWQGHPTTLMLGLDRAGPHVRLRVRVEGSRASRWALLSLPAWTALYLVLSYPADLGLVGVLLSLLGGMMSAYGLWRLLRRAPLRLSERVRLQTAAQQLREELQRWLRSQGGLRSEAAEGELTGIEGPHLVPESLADTSDAGAVALARGDVRAWHRHLHRVLALALEGRAR